MFKELLDEKSSVSCMRFLSINAFFIACVFGFVACVFGYMKTDASTPMTLAGMFLGASFGGKVAQKFAEVKSDGPV